MLSFDAFVNKSRSYLAKNTPASQGMEKSIQSYLLEHKVSEVPKELLTPYYIIAPSGGKSLRDFMVEYLYSNKFKRESMWDGPLYATNSKVVISAGSTFLYAVQIAPNQFVYPAFTITKVYRLKPDEVNECLSNPLSTVGDRPSHWKSPVTSKTRRSDGKRIVKRRDTLYLSPLRAILTEGQMQKRFGHSVPPAYIGTHRYKKNDEEPESEAESDTSPSQHSLEPDDGLTTSSVSDEQEANASRILDRLDEVVQTANDIRETVDGLRRQVHRTALITVFLLVIVILLLHCHAFP